MDDRPLEILPFGRTAEDQAKIDAKKAAGRRGMHGCLFLAFLVALFFVFLWGWSVGRHG